MNITLTNLDHARRYVITAICDGCQKKGTLTAHQVQKAGPNLDRFFAKCRHCGFFTWLSAPATADSELERLQAGATPCPRCGKGRRADRVRKAGNNQGRLFLTCNDPACGDFQWASPGKEPRTAQMPRATPSDRQLTEAGLLAEIRDRWEDDEIRLIYADWLDDQGQAERATLIRTQIERDQLSISESAWVQHDCLARTILQEHESRWTSALRPLVTSWKFARGLIDELEMEAAQFASHAGDMLLAAPTAAFRIRVEGWPGVKIVASTKQLTEVRRLTLAGERMGGAGARILAESPRITNLRSLTLNGQSLGQPGVQALAGSRYLQNLEVLDLTDNNLGRSAIPILVSSTNLPRLRRLILAKNLLVDSDARALANSPQLQALRELDLRENSIGREGLDALMQSPLRARLTRLEC
jgi:uncharacterized protein (TIGR02996 family)